MPITRGSVIILFMSLMSFMNAFRSFSVLPSPSSRTAMEFSCPAHLITIIILIVVVVY